MITTAMATATISRGPMCQNPGSTSASTLGPREAPNPPISPRPLPPEMDPGKLSEEVVVTVSAALDTFFATVPEPVLLQSLPDGVSVTFDLQGEGGGIWTVIRSGEGCDVVRQAIPAPDCRLRCTVADFRALLHGELDARRGFMERRLEVEGDVGLVLRLSRTVL